MKQGKDLLEAIEKGTFIHQCLDINLFMRAPVILIPQDVYRPEKPCFVVDSGLMQAKSLKLANFDPKTNYKLIEEPGKVHDLYEVKLESVSISLLEEGLPNGTSSYFQIHNQLNGQY
mmetsp:Transcript_8997/g.8366  ORF Transcript_8997/g.8366 Transcript_8997/m.8366 type:complete len:117 (-) Transcript_8997:543-893(-)